MTRSSPARLELSSYQTSQLLFGEIQQVLGSPE